jgi:hypothetical protein
VGAPAVVQGGSSGFDESLDFDSLGDFDPDDFLGQGF